MVRRAAVQVSREDAKADPASGAAAADAMTAAAGIGGFAGYGVAEKRGGGFALDKDVFWFAKQSKDRFRWNMLNPFPVVRKVGAVNVLWEFGLCKVKAPVLGRRQISSFTSRLNRATTWPVAINWIGGWNPVCPSARHNGCCLLGGSS